MLEDAQRGTKGSSKKGEAKNDPELWDNALSHSAAGGLEKTARNGDCAQKTEGKCGCGRSSPFCSPVSIGTARGNLSIVSNI